MFAVSIYWSLGARWIDWGQIKAALTLTISANSPPSSSTWIHRGSLKTAQQRGLVPDVDRPEHPVTQSLSILSHIVTCFWAITFHWLVVHSTNTVNSPGAVNWWKTLLDKLPTTVRNITSVGLTHTRIHTCACVHSHHTSPPLCKDKKQWRKRWHTTKPRSLCLWRLHWDSWSRWEMEEIALTN